MTSPTDRIFQNQTNYGSTPIRRRTDIFPRANSKKSQPPLAVRTSSETAVPTRDMSSFSEHEMMMNQSTNIHPSSTQLTQMRYGRSLGLEGYASNLNILLIFVPLGFLATFFHFSKLSIFILNFLGMIPLAMLLGKATEDIAEHTNNTMGAMLNVTFGNAVELILAISALKAGKLALVRDTISGSVLSNLLLVLGSAFFFGGLRFREQVVLPAVSEANADLLSFAVFGFSIPTLFAMAMPDNPNKIHLEARMSLVTAIGLLIIYVMYLYFQLYTHAELYEGKPTEEEEDDEFLEQNDLELANQQYMRQPRLQPIPSTLTDDSALIQREVENGNINHQDDEDEEKVASLPVATIILIGTVALVAIASEFLVESIDGFSHAVGLGEKFIAVIILPVVGNAVEHMSAILVARHNKIDLSIGIACGSSVQIALFVAPLLVVISWIFALPHLTLSFELFDTVCIGFSVFVVNATLRDSRSNWLEGAVLVMCYMIVCAAFYFMG